MKTLALILSLLLPYLQIAVARGEVSCPDPLPDAISGSQMLACIRQFQKLKSELPSLSRFEQLEKEIKDLKEQTATQMDLLTKIREVMSNQSGNHIEATYSYTFRFRGSDIVARRQRPNTRLYFYATTDNEVKVSLYMATKKIPVNITIDGKRISRTLYDSAEDLEIPRDALQFESLKKVSLASADERSVPTLNEDPRPAGVHYLELTTAVGVTIGEEDDFEVSGIVFILQKKKQ